MDHELFRLFQRLVRDLIDGKEESTIEVRGGQYSGRYVFKTKETARFMASTMSRYSFAVVFNKFAVKLPEGEFKWGGED
jgi:hypothetical protein